MEETRLIEDFFEFTVNAEGETVDSEFTLPSTFKNVQDILLTSNRKDLLAFRGKFSMFIGGKEIFAKNYRAELVMSGFHVSPNEKWRKLLKVEDLDKTGDQIDLSYTDDSSGSGTFASYKVFLYVRGERK